MGCCCWGFEEEWDRFLLVWDAGGVVEGCGVISMGSGAIVLPSFFLWFWSLSCVVRVRPPVDGEILSSWYVAQI